MKSNYLFSQIDAHQNAQLQGASAKVYNPTPSASNAGDERSGRTEGNATVAHIVVAPQNRSQASAFSSLLDLNHGHRFQLIKIGN